MRSNDAVVCNQATAACAFDLRNRKRGSAQRVFTRNEGIPREGTYAKRVCQEGKGVGEKKGGAVLVRSVREESSCERKCSRAETFCAKTANNERNSVCLNGAPLYGDVRFREIIFFQLRGTEAPRLRARFSHN